MRREWTVRRTADAVICACHGSASGRQPPRPSGRLASLCTGGCGWLAISTLGPPSIRRSALRGLLTTTGHWDHRHGGLPVLAGVGDTGRLGQLLAKENAADHEAGPGPRLVAAVAISPTVSHVPHNLVPEYFRIF